MTPVEEVLERALSSDGDRYVFGAEVSLDDDNPSAFDCSELVQWSCAQAGVEPTMPDGSWLQARHCNNHGLLIPVAEGIDTRGALLFKFSGDPFTGGRPSSAHVAFSLGDGTTIEARSSTYGVGIFDANGRGWTHAGLIPGVDHDPTDDITYTYRGVENVLQRSYGPAVVDKMIEAGIIINTDNRVDDWEATDYTDGRFWTFLYRLLDYLEE